MNLKLFLNCFDIFNRHDKIRLISITFIQILLNLLDLIGVVFIGLIGALTINGTSSRPPGDRVEFLLKVLRINNSSLQYQVSYIAIFASLMLIIKTLLSVYFTKKILFFLNMKSAILTKNLVHQIFSRSLSELNQKTRQENLSIMSGGVASVVNGVIYSFISILTDLTLLVILLAGLFIAEPIISIAAFTFFGGTAYLLFLTLKNINLRLNNERFYVTAENNGLILEFMNGFRESFVANRRQYYLNRIGGLQNTLAKNTAQISFLPNISKYILEIAIVLGSIVIAAIQFSHASASRSVAVLAIFLASSTRMVPAILRIQQSALQIRGSKHVAEITLRELGSSKSINEVSGTAVRFNNNHENFYPTIKISNLSFSHANSNNLFFEDINLNIEFGKVVAIVGPSGAGKSTLVDLILGLLKPTSGSITYGDLSPIETINRHPGAIAYVPQEIQIINGSLKENLILGYDINEVKEQVLLDAIEIAQLNEFVEGLPKGLNSNMGEMGSRLSGGQKQRIGIARALITNPRIIILDEATSALDNDTELALKNALMKLRKKTTLIIIAHRLSTVTESDQVIYLDNGKLLASGNLTSVSEKIPAFAKNLEKIIN